MGHKGGLLRRISTGQIEFSTGQIGVSTGQIEFSTGHLGGPPLSSTPRESLRIPPGFALRLEGAAAPRKAKAKSRHGREVNAAPLLLRASMPSERS
jgi:hypothetical protein